LGDALIAAHQSAKMPGHQTDGNLKMAEQFAIPVAL
jgi:hypothetical protein